MTDTEHLVDPYFDKKLLCFVFLIVLACLLTVVFLPNAVSIDARSTIITVLTSLLNMVVGGIITLTSGRSAATRTADTVTADGKTTTVAATEAAKG